MLSPPTSLVARRLAREMPKSMRSLPKDSRGYPVPWIVLIDKSGKPQFTINDHAKVASCLTKRLCAICGRRMSDGLWFVGGSRAFLHEHGAFLDPPLHLECAEYALAVCPFLAARRYVERLDGRLIDKENIPDNVKLVVAEYAPPNLPERFCLGLTSSFSKNTASSGQLIITTGPWEYLEFWKAGERCPAPDSGEPPPLL